MNERIRVTSTRDGFQGRKAGRTFDVTADEFARFGPDAKGPEKGLLRPVDKKAAAEFMAADAAGRAAALEASAAGENVTTTARKR